MDIFLSLWISVNLRPEFLIFIQRWLRNFVLIGSWPQQLLAGKPNNEHMGPSGTHPSSIRLHLTLHPDRLCLSKFDSSPDACVCN